MLEKEFQEKWYTNKTSIWLQLLHSKQYINGITRLFLFSDFRWRHCCCVPSQCCRRTRRMVRISLIFFYIDSLKFFQNLSHTGVNFWWCTIWLLLYLRLGNIHVGQFWIVPCRRRIRVDFRNVTINWVHLV